jgi:hypothetical protein
VREREGWEGGRQRETEREGEKEGDREKTREKEEKRSAKHIKNITPFFGHGTMGNTVWRKWLRQAEREHI